MFRAWDNSTLVASMRGDSAPGAVLTPRHEFATKDRLICPVPRLTLNKVSQIGLAVLTVALVSLLAVGVYQSSRTRTLNLAGGSADSDSHILCAALKRVVERHNPRVRINVLETGGTVENLQMLEQGSADLATAQADVMPGPSAQAVAVLFDDTFQLLVHEMSSVRNFRDLRGKRIGLARSGGQFDSFLRVADHFNLRQQDFHFIGGNDSSADGAFSGGAADALFRVRALGNPTIQRLANSGAVRFIPIAQAAAMKIRYPAFQPTTIPTGAYLGEPTIPEDDVPTIAVHRMLLARAGADPNAIRAVTAVLVEQRQEISNEIPSDEAAVRLLLAQIRRPDVHSDFGPGLHRGAASFYDKDKPSFLQANADYVGLMLSVVVMLGSWIWQLKGWMMRKQKNAGDEYSNRAMQLMTSAQAADSVEALDALKTELLGTLTAAVRDLDADKLSEISFQSFRDVLQIVLEVIRERRETLARPAAVGVAYARN